MSTVTFQGHQPTLVEGANAAQAAGAPTIALRILSSEEHRDDGDPSVLQLANDADPMAIEQCLGDVERIDLDFPKFTDGRAYSQAFLLRRRLGFRGDIRATGDVLIDQLVQMERMGFSSAVLKEGVDASAARRQFERFAAFYQGDAVTALPRFRRNGDKADRG
ncbi:conserved hypothetical protein [Burkholderiales bacterium 8X]|nr:conserved hypothetical protein [Burkholderiales bacterium 8X]